MTTIKVNNNGSLRVEGEFKIIDAAGNEFNLNGRTSVALCRCNLSKNRPFCDGSHKNTGFAPVKYTADEDKTVGFCGCKHSKKGPICDGSHKFIEGDE